ncbi:MAG: spore coat protein [Clostridia bacterium]|nr:spore coat protein [Clostridia bacterium]
MAANLGAHEVMELHEVLCNCINGINQMELLRPHVNDQQLSAILDKQVQFMTQEYNNLVQALNAGGINIGTPYQAPKIAQPKYGLQQPQPQSPNTSPSQLDDQDISGAMLSYHKSSAIIKTMAALECADPNLRRMVQQSAVNCSEMAYEVWQYMNQKGYYQVPTMKQMTTNTMIQSYTPANINQGDQNRMMMNNPQINPQINVQQRPM